MIALTWLRGLVAHRRGRLLATAAGVAVTVALLASIGAFLSATTARMTERAVARVAVDWQVGGLDASTGGSTQPPRTRIAVHRAMTPAQTLALGIEASRAALRFAHGARLTDDESQRADIRA